MPGNQKYHFQLQDRPLGGMMAGPSITGSGGTCFVCTAGSPAKASIFDSTGAAKTNPFALNAGSGEFYVANSVGSVDLYISAPDGQQARLFGAKPDALYDVPVDRGDMRHVITVPFALADSVAATEKDTGILLPSKCIVLPEVVVDVTTLEAAKTILFGTLSTQSGGVAAGFGTGVTLAAAVSLALQSRATKNRGSLFVDGAAGSPDNGYSADANTAKNISYTLSAGTTVAAGFIYLPILLLNRGQPTLN
jgi:hypothetical protein